MSTGTMLPREVPVAPELAPQFVQFEQPVRRFVVHNAKPRLHETMFAGNMMTVPACDRIRKDKTAYDADGDPIPGTYVIEDIYSWVDAFNDYVLTFDAEKAVRHILGIPQRRPRKPGDAPEPVTLTSPHAIRGLSLLPMNPTKETWHAVAKAGEHRAFLSAVEDARETVSAYETAAAKAKEAGKSPRPPRGDFHYAIKLLEQYDKLTRHEVEERVAPWRADAELEAESEEIEIEAEARAFADDLSTKLAAKHNMDKKALFDQLMDDPKVRAHAQKRYRFRKRGHLGMDEGAGAAGAADRGGMPDNNLLHNGGEPESGDGEGGENAG